MSTDGELFFKSEGKTISGWTGVRVTRGIERCPNDFDITLTDLYPDEAARVSIAPGQACQVLLGDDPVITGFVDRFKPTITARSHAINVVGRGKCQDLVDCSAEYPSGQVSNVTPLALANKLGEPYGVTASSLTNDTAGSVIIPQFNIMLGETAYEIIERCCRWAGLLAYEGTDGNLLLALAGAAAHETGVVEGQNCEEAEAEYSMDERYSAYVCFLQSMQVLGDVGQGGNLLATQADPNVPRHRLKYLIAEAGGGGQDVCMRRALWEAVRRFGRSTRFTVKVDSWRDGQGVLWTPNNEIPVELPGLKAPAYRYVIGEVTYVRDAEGSHAELTIMPRAAFEVEPLLLQAMFADPIVKPT